MRQWVMTGIIGSPSDDPDDPKAGRPPDERPSVKLAEGVKVSKTQMDAFAEMGGTMERQPGHNEIGGVLASPGSPDQVA